jgi:hypothetical protein
MRIPALTALIGILCLAGCDDSSDIILIPLSRTGTFVLQTVNNHGLPATVVDSINPAVRIDVTSGAITITATNAFTDVFAFRQTRGGIISTRTVSCTGTYTVDGNDFTFVEAVVAPDCGRTFTGRLSGNVLSSSVLGIPAVFIR